MQRYIQGILRSPFRLLLLIYRYLLDPIKFFFFSGTQSSCRYHPSCSVYAEEAIRKHGLFRGIILTAIRILKCNPWANGGHDPVPDRFQLLKSSK